MLTEYGRELSRELLSMWGREGEQRFAYGLIRPPSWLNLGGDYRSIYVYKDSAFATEGRSILMQADLEAAVTLRSWTAVASGGYQSPRGAVSLRDRLLSRRHYILYRPSDEWGFRAGRFFPAYGIQVPDHVIATKRGLGWDQQRESYNLEASWISEKWNLFGTAILGRPDAPSLIREKGVALSATYSPWDTGKVGMSYYVGRFGAASITPGNRHLLGPFGILGVTSKLTLLTEFDFQASTQTGDADTRWGAVNYQKISYEFTEGAWGFLTQEWSRLDFARESTLNSGFGVGLQWFPRPHVEINISWQKSRIVVLSDDYSDFAWLMFHYYL